MRRSHLTLLSMTALLALGACHKPPQKTVTDAEQARSVTVGVVALRPLAGAVTASGDLVSREEAAVLPEVSGYRVARVLVDVGSVVRKGEVLAELDPSLIQGQLAQAEAAAAQSAVQAEQAEDQAKRVQGLDNEGVLSQEQINQRRFQAKAARAAANAQAAALKDIRTRASKFKVVAPVGGLILERNVRPGDLAAVATTPWFRIARDSEIEMAAQVSETVLSGIHPGQHATVTLPSGGSVSGVVRLVSPQIDPQTKLGIVRIHLPVRSDIRAGGFGHAVFDDVTSQALTVPETSIRYDADGATVVTVGPDNRVKLVPVVTGERGGGLVQLLKGPGPGVRIVQNAAAFLLDGDLVRPTSAAPAPAPAPVSGAAPALASKAARR